MRILRLQLIFIVCIISGPIAADDQVSEVESQKYFFGLMQQGQAYKVHPSKAGDYLRGVWRLDRKAHIGAGHYTRADKGDDVNLICNDERLIQIDFNRNHGDFIELAAQLADLEVEEDGSWSFGKGRRYMPLGDNHMVVTAYDYIVILQRESGRTKSQDQTAFPAH